MKRFLTFVSLLALGGALFASPAALADGDTGAEAHGYAASLSRASDRVRTLLRATRARGTAHELRCVDEALSRVDAAARAAEGAVQRFDEAKQHHDDPALEHALTVLRIAYARGREAETWARACNDNGSAYAPAPTEGTSVRVVVDPSLPPTSSVTAGATTGVPPSVPPGIPGT